MTKKKVIKKKKNGSDINIRVKNIDKTIKQI